MKNLIFLLLAFSILENGAAQNKDLELKVAAVEIALKFRPNNKTAKGTLSVSIYENDSRELFATEKLDIKQNSEADVSVVPKTELPYGTLLKKCSISVYMDGILQKDLKFDYEITVRTASKGFLFYGSGKFSGDVPRSRLTLQRQNDD